MIETTRGCVLILLAEGFSETETVVLLSVFRQAGISVKLVGLTKGLVRSFHGVWLMPDLLLADLSQQIDMSTVGVVILPGGESHLSQLELDPRVHRLLSQVLAQDGSVVMDGRGSRILRSVKLKDGDEDKIASSVLKYTSSQPMEAFAHELIRRLEVPSF